MKKDLTGQVNRLKVTILLLTTNLSWWLMKQKKALTVLPVPLNLFLFNWERFLVLFNLT